MRAPRYGPGHVFDEQPDGMTYLFSLSDGDTIDGAEGGNATRFINHSCWPNCAAVEVLDPFEQLIIEIRTLRTIQSGEELTLDYELALDSANALDYRCQCGTPQCRGIMLGPKPSRTRPVSLAEVSGIG